jgi:RNA 3'-terminal phosphate cyclase (ATP)
VTEVVTGFGERRVRAEDVASRAVEEMLRYERSTAAVGEHLADQLLLPMAVGSGGVFTTLTPSTHTTTNIDVIRRFLDVEVTVTDEGPRTRIEVRRHESL